MMLCHNKRGILGLCLFAVLPAAAPAESIVHTKHNLSVTSPGPIKASSETDVCIFCHTVHHTTGQTPLWSHAMSSVSNYVIYSSPTMKATVGQPDGSSRLCLSCHDGTVALGMVSCRSTPIPMEGSTTTLPPGPSNLGTDLSGDHPISFVYDQTLASQDPSIKDPTTIDKKLKLDHLHKLQCVTCHNPHDDQFGSFLVMDNTGSAICLGCHIEPGWDASSHATSSAKVTALKTAQVLTNKAPNTVAASACQSCHSSHKAGSKGRLLIHSPEEQNCFVCHNGTVVEKDLRAEFNKPSSHPVLRTSTTHRANEDPVNSPRHTACSDCHNPHSVRKSVTSLRNAPRLISGLKGVNSVGVVVNATRQYELCFRCHSESLNRGPARVTRQFSDTNKRLQFDLSNQSFHPVESAGKNPNVPSLISPWTTASQMECTDCHNNDQGFKAGGSGADGPHGSAFTPILERQCLLTDETPESPGNYALCYKCHSRTSILGDQSFRAVNSLGQDRGHRFHIVDQRTPCATCHDSHGVASTKALINFNTLYVKSTSTGRPIQYISTGLSSGNCTLNCHGFDHDMTSYPSAPLTSLQKKIRR
jgi:predicted CXXCH cytochrome family protein